MRNVQTDRKKNKWTIVLFVWMFIAIAWFIFAIGQLPDQYISVWSDDYRTISNYSTFIETHAFSSNLLVNPLFVLCIGIIISINITLMSRQWWLIILLIPMILSACFLFWSLISQDGTTQLYHIDTINHEEHVYHLMFGKDNGDMLDKKYVLLFTCDNSGEICTSRGIVNPYASPNSQIVFDENNHLQIMSESQIIFTLDDD